MARRFIPQALAVIATLGVAFTTACGSGTPASPSQAGTQSADDTPGSGYSSSDEAVGGGSSFGVPVADVSLPGNVEWTPQLFDCDSWNHTHTCGPTSAAMAVAYLTHVSLSKDLVHGLVNDASGNWPCGANTDRSDLGRALSKSNIAFTN